MGAVSVESGTTVAATMARTATVAVVAAMAMRWRLKGIVRRRGGWSGVGGCAVLGGIGVDEAGRCAGWVGSVAAGTVLAVVIAARAASVSAVTVG